MYQVGGWLGLLRPGTRAERWSDRVPPAVLFLGLTSLITDISSEMVSSVLPIYLVGFLRMSPAQFGLLDGLYQGVSGLVQLVGAAFADRFRRHKEVAAFGYGASVVSRIGLVLTGGIAGVTACLALDRLGKGIRTAPRDALISLNVRREDLGLAFGVHRAMDSVGAMIGPIIAFVILRSIANGFDVVFVASLSAAVAGFAVLTLLVENRPSAAGGSKIHRQLVWATLRDPALRHLAFAALVLGLLTISDGFVYLALQNRTGLSNGAFPLLYVLTSACYLVCAIPVGRLADSVGRFPVFLAGHVVLVLLYLGLMLGPSALLMPMTLVLMGIYYASTEGVLMALGSAGLGEDLRTSGLALLTTTLALGRFAGSVVFGQVWSRFGAETAFALFLTALVLAIAVLALTAPGRRRAEA